MAQAAAITLNNHAAVGVIFNPEQVSPALTTFVDRSSGVASQFNRLSARYLPAGGARKSTKSSLKFATPITGTLPSGAIGIIRTLRATVEFDFDDGSTDTERKDIYALVSNGLANPLLRGALRDHDPCY